MGSLSSKPKAQETSADQVQQQQEQCAMQQQQQQVAHDVQTCQQQVQFSNNVSMISNQLPARRMSNVSGRSRFSMQTSHMDFSSNQSADFGDDDSLPMIESVAAAVQPEPDPALAADGVLTVSTRVEYSALPKGQHQDVFGLVTVQAANLPEPDPAADPSASETRQPMDLVCVLDTSGSMRHNKLDQVKSAVRFVIEQASPKDRVSIVQFNSNANRVLRLRKMDKEGQDAAITETLRLQAGGGTRSNPRYSPASWIRLRQRCRSRPGTGPCRWGLVALVPLSSVAGSNRPQQKAIYHWLQLLLGSSLSAHNLLHQQSAEQSHGQL